MSGGLEKARKRAETLRFHVTLEVLRLMPLGWILGILRFRARAAYHLEPRKQKKVRRWLEEMVPADRSRAKIDRLTRHFFVSEKFRRYLHCLLYLHDAADHSDLMTVEGWDRVEEALRRKRGAVLLSSHAGLPSMTRWYLRTQSQHRVFYLLRIGFPGALDRSWRTRFDRWHRNRYGVDADELFGNEELSIQYLKKAHDHLRQNGIVVIAGDGHRGRRSYPVTILGRTYTLADGGLALGLLSGAAIFPCFGWVDDSCRFRLAFDEPLVPEREDRPGQARALVDNYAARISSFISRHPESVTQRRYWSSPDRSLEKES